MSVIYSKNFIGGLPENITEQDLFDAFVIFGTIKNIEIIKRDNDDNYAYIYYTSSDDSRAAIDNMHLNQLFGNIITCNFKSEG